MRSGVGGGLFRAAARPVAAAGTETTESQYGGRPASPRESLEPFRLLGPKLRDGVFYVSRRHSVCYASLLVFHALFTRSCFFVLFFCFRRGSEMQTASI